MGNPNRGPVWSRRSLAAAAVVVAAGLLTGVAPAHAEAGGAGAGVTLPAPTGPHRVGTWQFHLVDTARTDPWMPGGGRAN
ncbi:hypothetical protein [Streptoalloteichus hindustanus]|uniref:Uncharacterized protein n=1 Tax=Streptoalloteichus hindustanus TaxID=2017 RepID=A0A1M5LZW8_STRHI|nr:hypothetical protein [Streptoalloteichus hindustanus]SHG70229.1 hypothetical protein SAMN05444320_112112 [Streptoalloteichus hindustanus]